MTKQGRATSSGPGDKKREPIVNIVNPGGADQLGQAAPNRRAITPLYEGHGHMAPKGPGLTVHPRGTQGKR